LCRRPYTHNIRPALGVTLRLHGAPRQRLLSARCTPCTYSAVQDARARCISLLRAWFTFHCAVRHSAALPFNDIIARRPLRLPAIQFVESTLLVLPFGTAAVTWYAADAHHTCDRATPAWACHSCDQLYAALITFYGRLTPSPANNDVRVPASCHAPQNSFAHICDNHPALTTYALGQLFGSTPLRQTACAPPTRTYTTYLTTRAHSLLPPGPARVWMSPDAAFAAYGVGRFVAASFACPTLIS